MIRSAIMTFSTISSCGCIFFYSNSKITKEVFAYLAEKLFGILKDIMVVFGCGWVHPRQLGCREEEGCKGLLMIT